MGTIHNSTGSDEKEQERAIAEGRFSNGGGWETKKATLAQKFAASWSGALSERFFSSKTEKGSPILKQGEAFPGGGGEAGRRKGVVTSKCLRAMGKKRK